ncbi:MAG: hypothetical protein JRJ85_19350 [Deltaproteobacteria bacterium]|nr:hypothetical protein [Deltaproteobacteria bacterium]
MELIKIKEKDAIDPHIFHASATQYHSVEFSVNGSYYVYQFKLRNMRESSMGVLVREDSEIMDLLKVGDIIKMKYYPKDSFLPPELLDTEIRYIAEEVEGRFPGHYMVGLSLLAQAPHNQLH